MRSAFVLPVLCAATLALTASCRRAAADPEREAEARQAYRTTCARCHGADGRGGLPVAGVQPRNFHDEAFQRSRTDDDLVHAVREGKGAMPAFRAVYDDRQIAELVRVIRSFR